MDLYQKSTYLRGPFLECYFGCAFFVKIFIKFFCEKCGDFVLKIQPFCHFRQDGFLQKS